MYKLQEFTLLNQTSSSFLNRLDAPYQ